MDGINCFASNLEEVAEKQRGSIRKQRLEPRMSKFYSVRQGRSIGVYRSWEECREQVLGFKGSEFKPFRTLVEAEDYLRG